jgi:hypothetical protein
MKTPRPCELRHAAALAIVALSVLSASGQPAAAPPASGVQEALPDAKAVIAGFVKKIGGANAFEKIDSQHIKGKLQMPGQGIAGNLEVFSKRPDKALMKVNVPGIGDLIQGYDGKTGWAVNAVMGPMLLEGKMLEEFREQVRFDADLHKESEFKSMETVEKTEFDGKPCHKLKLIRQSGQEVMEYFEVESGLLIGSSQVQETPLGPLPVTASLGEYKKFGDTLFATRLTQKTGPLQQVMTIETMEFNTVKDSVFELPETIKALVK